MRSATRGKFSSPTRPPNPVGSQQRVPAQFRENDDYWGPGAFFMSPVRQADDWNRALMTTYVRSQHDARIGFHRAKVEVGALNFSLIVSR